jgi:hypothetical protein
MSLAKKQYYILNFLFLILIFISCREEKLVFVEKVLDPTGPDWCWMKTSGDFNGDGIDDLVIGGYRGGGISAYMSPDHRKETITDMPGAKTDAEVWDVDRDGDLDLISLFDSTVWWFRNPDWEAVLIDTAASHDLEMDDLDGDGWVDLVLRDQAEFGSSGDKLVFILQKGPDLWESFKMEIPNGEGLKLADLDQDGEKDILINGWWLKNSGNIHDWLIHRFTDTWDWRNTYIDVTDFNKDGRVDIVMSPSELAGNYYRLSWFEQPDLPTTTWEEHVIIDPIETVLHYVGAADFDGDTWPDISYAEMIQGIYPHEVVVLWNDPEQKWKKSVISLAGSHSMRITDVDGDGDPDLYGANWQDDTVKVWINQKIKK